jgi:alpha-methylacyl-CoA racemase
MGPLKGVKILEVGGIGPAPFCGMMLSDMGAEVIRIERKDQLKLMEPKYEVLLRNRRSIALNLRKREGVDAVLRIVDQIDAIFEGFRPGVMEKLGLGPDVCLSRNPKLVYGRMTGWGQEGPLSNAAGHDINYISLSGALHAIGRAGKRPVPPLNLVGDFGGGGMLLAFGMVCALFESRTAGKGQVVDAAMVDGSAALMAMIYGMHASGLWTDDREANLIDGGAHFYDTYETADGKYISIGSIEPQFYTLLIELAEIDDAGFENQLDRRKWPELKDKLKKVFKQKSRNEWCSIMEGSDICFAPVLSMEESVRHPHNQLRKTFVDIDGVKQPGPAPRYSRTRPEIQGPPPDPGADTDAVLADFGFSADEVQVLKDNI